MKKQKSYSEIWRKKRRITCGSLFSIGCLLFSIKVYGIGDAGIYGAFLSYWAPSARTLGMAGAVSGLANDGSAGYFNPAGLVQLNTQEVSFMHSIIFAGLGTCADVLMYARPASGTSGFGVTVFHIYTPGIEYRDPERPTGSGYTFTNREVAGLITYSTRLIGPVWAGVNAKIFYHQLYKWMSMGFGTDVGLYFFPDQTFSLGINVQNAIKPSVKLIDESNTFPLVLRSGFAVRPWSDKLSLTVDMIWSEYRKPVFGAGVEYRAIPALYLRAGFNQSYAGLGLGVWKDQRTYEVKLDYALEIPHQAGSVFGMGHNFSLTMMFGGYRAKAHCPVTAFSPTSGEEGKNISWIYFNISPRTEVKKWQVLIKDANGTVVRKIEAWSTPPYRVAWDGKDDNAILVPDGKYYYTLRVVERDGRTWDHEGFLATMTTMGPPGTVIIRSRGEQPTYIQEERKEQGKKTEEKKKTTRSTRRR
ncbi:MAG: hypothetical protein HY769_03220 [Candidatus Stahlbacteria bacterium]|nr:hypothetical protein [Candidatus Stahlbacteria bacterium]